MVNQVGANDSLIFDGASFAVNPNGEVMVSAKEFAKTCVSVSSRAKATLPACRRRSPRRTRQNATWNALVLGTRDYLRKCGFKKAVIGLSGGIDSALVAAIAVEALGKENVQGVGMPSEFSSSGSVSDAEKLAKNLGD